MTEAIMRFTFAPLSGFWSTMWSIGESAGRARAAAELSRMGMHEEAKRLMLEKQNVQEIYETNGIQKLLYEYQATQRNGYVR